MKSDILFNRKVISFCITIFILPCLIIISKNNYNVYCKPYNPIIKLYKVKVSTLRIRNKPSITSSVVGSIPKDIIFEGRYHEDELNTDNVDGIDGIWVSSGFFGGYIFTGYLQDVSDEYFMKTIEEPPYFCDIYGDQLKCNVDIVDTKDTISLKYIDKIINSRSYCPLGKKKDELFIFYNYKDKRFKKESPFIHWQIFFNKKTNNPVQINCSDGVTCGDE